MGLPILGAIGLSFLSPKEEHVPLVKTIALGISCLVFLLSLWIFVGFDSSASGYQFQEAHEWIPKFKISYHLGVDGISLALILLTTLWTPICILASWKAITKNLKLYMSLFLVLESFIIGAFSALDLLLFYIFFEGALIPMFLLIGIWGGERRIYAAIKFFLYTLAGSVLLLVSLFTIYSVTGTLDILQLSSSAFSQDLQIYLWLGFFASFAIKIPMWPLHTWLPDAHVEAPTAASVILAAILLKMGGYGFLRFNLPLFPEASQFFAPMMFMLSIIAITYTSLVAWVQKDMKKLIAYSSIAHMGFVTLGIFTFTQEAVTGAMVQMISHGLISGGLFLCVGVLYDRVHTRQISQYGGVASVMPKFAFVFLILTFASIGLPGTSGFIGELLVILGGFSISGWLALGAGAGLIFGVLYALTLYKDVVFGPVKHNYILSLKDMSMRESLLFIPIIGFILSIGLYANPFIKLVEKPIKGILKPYTTQPFEEEGPSTHEIGILVD
jgi:NADH-quinone oxidoreductase subunit M